MGLLSWLLELLLEAGMLVTVRPLGVVEGQAKLLDLRAEPIAVGLELLALGPEPVALDAEDLNVVGLLSWLLQLLFEAGAVVTVRPLGVVEGQAKLFGLGTEPIAFGRELLSLGPEPVAIAAEGFDFVRLLACLPELLLEAGTLVTVRSLDVVEGAAQLFDLRAEPIAFSMELVALGPELLALGPEPVALAPEGLDIVGLLSCLPELFLEAGTLITVRPLDVVEGAASSSTSQRSRSPSARSCSPSARSCSRSLRSRSPSPWRASTT